MKPRFIDANMFLEYTGTDLFAKLKDTDNPSAKVDSFLGRVEIRVMSWVDKNTFRVRDWGALTQFQLKTFRYALLEQAYYMYRNGDIAQDSGYDQEKGLVVDNHAKEEIIICQPCINFLIQAGLFNATVKNRRRFMHENPMIGDGLPPSRPGAGFAPSCNPGLPEQNYYTQKQIDDLLALKEDVANKVQSIDDSESHYPSSKAVKEALADISNSVNVTYEELVTLRNANNLVPGRFYRITDYTCTTSTTNTSSAGHVFDIIVRADTNNKLNEQAHACKHEGDTYFANCFLEAWQIKYCLDNDTNRFEWADNTSGRGVIYFMKDEYGNEAPYDFKNILFSENCVYIHYGPTGKFSRDPSHDSNGYYAWRAGDYSYYYIYSRTGIPTLSTVFYGSDMTTELSVKPTGIVNYSNKYTFNRINTNNDATLLQGNHFRNNVIKSYIIGGISKLNFVVLNVYSDTQNNIFNDCHDIFIQSTREIRFNSFDECYWIVSQISSSFQLNYFYNSYLIAFYGTVTSCNFERSTDLCFMTNSSTTQNVFYRCNTLKVTEHADVSSSVFKAANRINLVKQGYYDYIFLNYCNDISFDGNGNNVKFKYITVESKCSYLVIQYTGTGGSISYTQNLHIWNGITGASSLNPRIIATTGVYNQEYTIEYKRNNTREVLLDD